MSAVFTICLAIIWVTVFAGILVCFFVSTKKAFHKFNSLEKGVQKKILLIEYYMAFVRKLSAEELIKMGKLPDEEIVKLNNIHDWNECIKIVREKIDT